MEFLQISAGPSWKHHSGLAVTDSCGGNFCNIFDKYLEMKHIVKDIFDAVQAAVQDAEGEVQVESPLGSHDEL